MLNTLHITICAISAAYAFCPSHGIITQRPTLAINGRTATAAAATTLSTIVCTVIETCFRCAFNANRCRFARRTRACYWCLGNGGKYAAAHTHRQTYTDTHSNKQAVKTNCHVRVLAKGKGATCIDSMPSGVASADRLIGLRCDETPNDDMVRLWYDGIANGLCYINICCRPSGYDGKGNWFGMLQRGANVSAKWLTLITEINDRKNNPEDRIPAFKLSINLRTISYD